jgi:hypothetical protein
MHKSLLAQLLCVLLLKVTRESRLALLAAVLWEVGQTFSLKSNGNTAEVK